MSLRDKRWINVDNIKTLGKFYTHYADQVSHTAPQKPIFKVEHQSIEKDIHLYTLIPGYMDREERFHSCPMEVFYIQINNIYEEEDFTGRYPFKTTVTLNFTIFSKDFSSYKNNCISFSKQDSAALDFMSFNRVINLLNEYVESGRNIEFIDFDRFDRFKPEKKDREVILNVVDDLQVDFFSNSINRVGKDNGFWDEAEIRNLPDDIYFKNLILKNLPKQCSQVLEADYGLLLIFEVNDAYSPSHPREKIENCQKRIKKLKELLKLDLAISFNSNEHVLECIKRKTAPNTKL